MVFCVTAVSEGRGQECTCFFGISAWQLSRKSPWKQRRQGLVQALGRSAKPLRWKRGSSAGGGIEMWHRKLGGVPRQTAQLSPVSQQFSSKDSAWADVAGCL